METLQIHSWLEDYSPDWTISALQDAFSDKSRYRVNVTRYEPGIRVSGAMLPGQCFVFQGTIAYSFQDAHFILTAGQYTHLPEGEFQIEAQGSLPAKVAVVWDRAALTAEREAHLQAALQRINDTFGDDLKKLAE